jgi:hypothetical protein
VFLHFAWRGFGLSVLSAERVRRLSLGVPVVDDVFQVLKVAILLFCMVMILCL